jgi:pyruvate dehydrogenase (quinone)
MGPGVPYAIAAKFAFPERVVIASVGDGAMLMNGINELVTIANNWQEWTDPRLIILVIANRDLNMVTWEQRILAGDPRFNLSQTVPEFAYARYGEMLGLIGIRVDKTEDIGPAWEQALAANRPVVLEAITDPEVPILPPHITFAQAEKFMESMAKGEPHLGHMIKQTVKDAIDTFLPHR